MRRSAIASMLGVVLASAGCGGDAKPHVRDGGGHPPSGCQPGEAALEGGGCAAAGIPPEACGAGFEPDDDRGCKAILPETPCADGELAVPGDTSCHPVAPCAIGRWGDIPVERSTQYVDAAYTGNDADGTPDRPWPTVMKAVTAAAPGAIIAIADGVYDESVSVKGKTVRFWGRCPDYVTIAGLSPGFAIDVQGAAGTEVHTLGISGAHMGLGFTDTTGALVDRVWIHDTAHLGVLVSNALGPAALTIRDSLIEGALDLGVADEGSELTFETSVVRETEPNGGPDFGMGIRAINGQIKPARASVTVRGSLVERNHAVGISFGSSDGTVETTVVRDMAPDENGVGGVGLALDHDPSGEDPSVVSMRASVVERAHDLGIAVIWGELSADAIAVRDIDPAKDGRYGTGIYVEGNRTTGAPSKVSVTRSTIDRAHNAGIAAIGSDLTVSATRVTGTQPTVVGQHGGLGIGIGPGATGNAYAASIDGSVFEGNSSAGVMDFGCEVSVANTLVRGTLADPTGLFGDGFGVGNHAALSVTWSRVESSTRAAVANFGAAVSIANSVLECNGLDLDGEPFLGADFSFEDAGGNACGCGGTTVACKVLSSHLEPPAPLEPKP